jgi:hypothetical protein
MQNFRGRIDKRATYNSDVVLVTPILHLLPLETKETTNEGNAEHHQTHCDAHDFHHQLLSSFPCPSSP